MMRVSMPKRLPSVLLLTALGVVSLSSGCRKKAALPAPPSELDDPSAQESTEPVASASKPEPPKRCREVNPGTLFAVGDAEAPKRTDALAAEGDEDSDEPIAMPFGVELGGVTGYKAGFAAGLLQSRRQGQRASIALIRADGSGRTVELDAVHGDVEAPFVAAGPGALVILFGDQDAAGATLRTALLPFDAERASFGPELLSVDRASGAALAVSGESALVAYSELDKGKSRFTTVRFGLDDKKLAAKVFIDTQKRDVESPRLSARPGGFWLGWVEQLPASPAKASPKSTPQSDDSDGERAGLELGPRALRLVALDSAGRPQGAPLSLTKADSHVLSFELAPWPDGGAVLAWRDDLAAPGVEGGALQLAHVRPDGSVENGQVEGELGAGVPSLLVDPEPRSAGSVVWLVAGGGSEPTRFGLLTGNGTTVTELTDDQALGLAELVGVRGGRLLAARPRQTAQDLSLLECSPK
jgi:hypothetical protein